MYEDIVLDCYDEYVLLLNEFCWIKQIPFMLYISYKVKTFSSQNSCTQIDGAVRKRVELLRTYTKKASQKRKRDILFPICKVR